MNEQYLLCVQHPGLNDVLCQFEVCFAYAQTFNRTLLLDTRSSGLMGEFGDFFKVIDTSVPVICDTRDWDYSKLNALSCHPKILQGSLDDYAVHWTGVYPPYVEKNSSVVIGFDFEKDYEEDVLVHEQPGGGELSVNALRRLRLTTPLLNLVNSQIARCPFPYIGVHVRNTDYTTDYKSFFSEIFDRVRHHNVLICSDDGRVFDYAKSFFSESTVFTLQQNLRTDGQPLHRSWSHNTENEKSRAAISSFVDLFALASAEILICSKVSRGHYSGFSKLAMRLNEDTLLRDRLLSTGE